MNLQDAIQWSKLGSDLTRVMPEIWLIITMCAVILVPFVRKDRVKLPTIVAMVGLLLALVYAMTPLLSDTGFGPGIFHMLGIFGAGEAGVSEFRIFHGMLVVDPFSQFFKVILIFFTMLVIVQWMIASRQESNPLDVPDYLCLLLGAVAGMALMASASNLVMIFIAMETASLPSYALAGFRRRNRAGSEGSLKYVLFGSAASAIMLYGMSLIYGTTGSLDLAQIASRAAGLPVLREMLHPAANAAAVAAAGEGNVSPLLAVGLLAMFAGFAFKLSAVPLHFWCPDVFEGAPIDVTTFLSVASKGAAVCLLVRVLQTFGHAALQVHSQLAYALANPKTPAIAEALNSFHPTQFIGLMVAVGAMGAVTATWGNLVALRQGNIRRLLAYSSIAHAGYMIMGASVIIIANTSQHGSLSPVEPNDVSGVILFYLLVYMFMNLGAFTVAALYISQGTGQEHIRDYAGLIRRSPALAVLMILFLLSLFGMPALGGFMGKIYLMSRMFAAGTAGFVLIAVLLINTLFSLYFYMRPVYYMIFVPDTENRPSFAPPAAGLALLVFCAAMLFWTGLFPNYLSSLTHDLGAVVVPGSPVQVRGAGGFAPARGAAEP